MILYFGLNKYADERAAATMRVTNDALVTAHTQIDEIPHDFTCYLRMGK